MIPWSVVIALFLAFGFEPPDNVSTATDIPTRAEIVWSVFEVVGVLGGLGLFAIVYGRFIAWIANRYDRASPRLRRAQSLGARVFDILTLVAYGRIIHNLEWPKMVARTVGDVVLLDELLIFLPYLIARLLTWRGLYNGELALGRTKIKKPGRYLWLKARQAFGMVVPPAVVYAVGSDVVRTFWPEFASSPWEKSLGLALMGMLVLLSAPLLIRIAWPTHSLPPGPLRDRLEHLGKRVGFRCTDILVWDTNGMVINAGVTGALPWFRYVLLTDALIDRLNPIEIAAVFGHEIGHIAHRHLVSFALFILGSLGVYALTEFGINALMLSLPRPSWLGMETTAALVLQLSVALLAIGGYFLIVFGHLSRRFERQADVFACRVVSCGLDVCPPHLDPDEHGLADPRGTSATLCPIGIRIFVTALSNVAYLNGMQPAAWSWRHGSIHRRIAFLESLSDRPDAEQRFQNGVNRMRKQMVLLLASTLFVAFWSGLFS